MATLIVTFIMAILFTFIAVQNTGSVTVNLFNTVFTNVPLFLVILGSLLVGLLLAGFVSAFESFASFLILKSKDTQISSAHTTIEELNKKLQDLKLENARLKEDQLEDEENREKHIRQEHIHPRFSFFERLRHSF